MVCQCVVIYIREYRDRISGQFVNIDYLKGYCKGGSVTQQIQAEAELDRLSAHLSGIYTFIGTGIFPRPLKVPII